MRNLNQHNITDAAIARYAGTPDARLKEVMSSLIKHVHAFAKEVKLTEDEWVKGIEFLTQAGHITDDKRQEFILLSDILGLSMLTVAMNNDKPAGCTEATVLGPFRTANPPSYNLGEDIANGAKGAPCLMRGSIKGLNGEAIPNARIEVWQSDEEGLYDVQHPDVNHAQGRGVLHADASGNYHFKSVLAEAYPIPSDGPVGALLIKTKNHHWRPAHLHYLIEADGYETLTTHVFRRDDKYLDSDVVFGVRESLIADWKQNDDGSYLLEYDFVLNPKKK